MGKLRLRPILNIELDFAPIPLIVTNLLALTADRQDSLQGVHFVHLLAMDKVQAISRDAHTTLGCRGFSRSDMIISGDEVIWLETNTIPGMTETSLLPQGAAAAGLSFRELLTKIINAALI